MPVVVSGSLGKTPVGRTPAADERSDSGRLSVAEEPPVSGKVIPLSVAVWL